jgi:N-acetylneuraminic acid mutarotase
MKACAYVLTLVASLSLSACSSGGGSTPPPPPPPPTYTIGGTVQGLSGAGLVLQDNSGNNLSVGANGAFTFTTPLTSGGAYNVTVLTQPSGPAQNCLVTNGNGNANADVTNVQIACVGDWTWVGGSQLQFQLGTYGNLGSAAPSNVPGARDSAVSWTDASGNLWLFSGELIDDAGPTEGLLNDLWQYSPSSGEWTWMSGSNTTNQSGAYGTQENASLSSVPGARLAAVSWTDASENFWLFGGGGFDSTGSYGELNDLWEYSPSLGEWTWVGGSNLAGQPGVYGTLGIAAPGNVPGARELAVTWTDKSGNFWLFGGAGIDSRGTSGGLNDLWNYNPSSGQWTWIAGSEYVNPLGVYGTEGSAAPSNVPGARANAATWIDASGNLWLFGGRDFNSNGETFEFLNDLWMFNPSAAEWTWVGGSSAVDQIGIYGTQGIAAPGNVPGARSQAVSWTDADGNFWFFGGSGYDSQGNGGCACLNDLWKYSAGQWTWMGGSNVSGEAGTYGTEGTPAPGNVPGARIGPPVGWTDPSGNFWLFGGFGLGAGANPLLGLGEFNDLWQYQP